MPLLRALTMARMRGCTRLSLSMALCATWARGKRVDVVPHRVGVDVQTSRGEADQLGFAAAREQDLGLAVACQLPQQQVYGLIPPLYCRPLVLAAEG